MNPEGGDGNFTHYHLTDHQFSTVALIDNAANLLERVTYDAYGNARHHWAGDITGDGAVGRADQTAMRDADRSSIGHVDYNVDADISRTGTVTNDDVTWTNTLNFKAALPKGVLSAPEVGNTIGYAGYVFNPEVQLYTVRFRHYDPVLGRWLERDPLGYVDGMSLYGYGLSSPLVFIDPLGLSSINPKTLPTAIVAKLTMAGKNTAQIIREMIKLGFSNKAIATALGISVKTVKRIRDAIKKGIDGPSGKPKRHGSRSPTRKKSKDRARQDKRGDGGKPERHGDHWHPSKDGEKVPGSCHYYP